jgi:hypothetical protein
MTLQGKLDNLLTQGFDQSFIDPEAGKAYVRCSQCDPCVIQGVACHERGCINEREENESRGDWYGGDEGSSCPG